MPETQYFSYTLKLSNRSSPSGKEFPAKIAYWSLGDTSKPTIMMPTCYSGTLESTSPYLYGPSDSVTFPLASYHILIVGLLGGGESSSPSNTPAPFSGPDFPKTTYEDNIKLQHALCQHLGIKHLEAYIGFSMGGQQAYHFGVLHPDFISHIVCLATSARTSYHNWSFLEGPKAALISSVDFQDGKYKEQPRIGLRAFGRVYSTWALSQDWFRQQCWKERDCDSVEEYLQKYWDQRGDANDLLAMLWTWQHGDISACFPEDKGDLTKTLGRIKAKALIMPSRTDMYFPPEDNEEEVKHLKNGKFEVIESVWGHLAGGGGGTEDDKKFVSDQVGKFLKD